VIQVGKEMTALIALLTGSAPTPDMVRSFTIPD
jgi:hypothetical protein